MEIPFTLHTVLLKDRQQEAEGHSRYLALLSISDRHNIIIPNDSLNVCLSNHVQGYS